MSDTMRQSRGAPPRKQVVVKRRGSILVLATFLMVFMMLLLAVSVDVGYMMTAQTEMERTDGRGGAGRSGRAHRWAGRGQTGVLRILRPQSRRQHQPDRRRSELEATPSDALQPAPGRDFDRDGHVESGRSQARSRRGRHAIFTDRGPALRHPRGGDAQQRPAFFARVFGQDRFNVTAESIARYHPRDIALVLDFSGSMNDDSELKRIESDGTNREAVEGNLLDIYHELESPTYGNLQFEPQYLTIVGQPPTGPKLPQITVTFRADDVYVVSTKDLSNVVMEFSDGSRQKIEGLTSPTGYFRGTGGNYNKSITKIWVKSGTNESGEGPGYGERFEDNNDTIKAAFALANVAYPYPSGSWNDYINYVKTSSSVRVPGYKKKYGYMTLINYWLENKAAHSQTPDLWKVSAQPITAVKDASDIFMDYIQEVDTDDRAALVIYNSVSQTAIVEHPLTARLRRRFRTPCSIARRVTTTRTRTSARASTPADSS